MLKTGRNVAIDLRKRRNFINLEEINIRSCITIVVVVTIFVLSVLLFALSPSSNFPTNL